MRAGCHDRNGPSSRGARAMLKERSYVVTGGLGRVGTAIRTAILGNGGRVVVTTRRPERAEEFNRAAPEGVRAVAFDPVEQGDYARFWSGLRAELGEVAGLVNNAMGTIPDKPLAELTPADWTDAVKVDLADPLALSAALVAEGRPVSIVNVSSIYGAMAPDFAIYRDGRTPPSPIYAATKAAQLQLTRYLAVAWADRGVRVNAVCLGGVRQSQSPDFLQAYGRMVPQGRMILPREAGDSVCFLLSDLASGTTGETLFVDGGRHAW